MAGELDEAGAIMTALLVEHPDDEQVQELADYLAGLLSGDVPDLETVAHSAMAGGILPGAPMLPTLPLDDSDDDSGNDSDNDSNNDSDGSSHGESAASSSSLTGIAPAANTHRDDSEE